MWISCIILQYSRKITYLHQHHNTPMSYDIAFVLHPLHLVARWMHCNATKCNLVCVCVCVCCRACCCVCILEFSHSTRRCHLERMLSEASDRALGQLQLLQCHGVVTGEQSTPRGYQLYFYARLYLYFYHCCFTFGYKACVVLHALSLSAGSSIHTSTAWLCFWRRWFYYSIHHRSWSERKASKPVHSTNVALLVHVRDRKRWSRRPRRRTAERVM